MAEPERIVAEVASAVGLAEGEPGVRAVVAALARLEPVSIRRISRAAELPVPIVAAVCGELRKRSIVAHERPAQLTPLGRAAFSRGALRHKGGDVCPTCAGREVVVPARLRRLVAEVERRSARAPQPLVELDQCHCTADSKLRRVLAMHHVDALVGRRVLLLGDDDLISLALATIVDRLGTEATLKRLTVVDLDARLVSFLSGELAASAFPTSVVRHDLREPLPAELVGAFDTVVTDPPFTASGARLFLSRAADALAGASGDVFLSFGSKRPGAVFELQRAILEQGFAIRRLVRDFNEYVGAGVLGGTSHLYHLVATEHLCPAVTGTFDGPLYTADR